MKRNIYYKLSNSGLDIFLVSEHVYVTTILIGRCFSICPIAEIFLRQLPGINNRGTPNNSCNKMVTARHSQIHNS